MLQAILVWVGAVLALGLLLLMALGPVIVEVDSWWYERRHNRKRAAARRKAEKASAAQAAAAQAARPRVAVSRTS
jgi:hypothetical protein